MSETVKKVTKRDKYSVIKNVLAAAESNGITLDGDVTYPVLYDFVDNELNLLDSKAESARKRAAQKKEDGDALREIVFSHLTSEPQIINSIVAAIDDPDVSGSMVTARLKDLVHSGRAQKTVISVPASTEGGKTRKLSAYFLA